MACSVNPVRVLTLAEFLRREPVAVRREGAVGVGGGEPGGAEESGFHFGELDVGVFGEAARAGGVSFRSVEGDEVRGEGERTRG